MKVVIDCNVIVSAGIKADGVCGIILKNTLQYHNMLISHGILKEYITVLNRKKFKNYFNTLQELLYIIGQVSTPVIVNDSKFTLPDPDDQIYIDTAISGGADFLVTGNLKHFPEKTYQAVKIISPREFHDIIID